jgi:hypothetical protein
MRAAFAAGLLLTAFAVPASAAPLDAGDRAKLEGVWRSNDNPKSDACGTDGNFQYGVEITIEFKLTGGEIYFEDQAEGSGGDTITSATKDGGTIFLKLADRSPAWDVKFTGKDKATFYDRPFTRCMAAEPRTNLALNKSDMNYLATGLIPAGDAPFYGVYFADSRVPGGCKAKLWQGLAFDLRHPAYASLLRIDSPDLTERLEARKPAGFARDTDGMGRWIVDGVKPSAGGWSFTLVELIPPNGSRGDKVTVEVQRTKAGITIPAWKRTYQRCTFS